MFKYESFSLAILFPIMNKVAETNLPPDNGLATKPGLCGGSGEPAEIASSVLLQGRSRVLIEHMGERYCLQLTRAGKLILTK